MILRRCLSALLALSLSTVACSWSSDGGLTRRYESETVTAETPEGSWNGEPIRIDDEHGVVEIVGVPGKRNITVRARFVAGATSQEDANAAFDDLGRQLGPNIVKKDGVWTVGCFEASAWHGSVDPETTGCTSYRVEVPSGTLDAPLELQARSNFGGVHASGIVVKRLALSAPFGLVADVVPAKGADISLLGDDSLASGFCSSHLRVPAGTSFESVEMTVGVTNGARAGVDPADPSWWPGVEVEGVALAPRSGAYSGRFGPSGASSEGASRAVVHAKIGKATIGSAPVPSVGTLNLCRS